LPSRSVSTSPPRAGKQIILAADGDAAKGVLGRIVVEAEAAIFEAAAECGPTRQHITESR